MGSCLQMVDEDENLRWAFIKDPYRKVKVLVPDSDKPVKDGYLSNPSDIEPAYRGKHIVKTIGEEYVDMISGWYRVADEKITGGYQLCPLYLYNDEVSVDNQGGACDNDVHEHFKCLEETLLKKAFVIISDKVTGYNCNVKETDGYTIVEPYEECEMIHINSDRCVTIKVNGKEIKAEKGRYFQEI